MPAEAQVGELLDEPRIREQVPEAPRERPRICLAVEVLTSVSGANKEAAPMPVAANAGSKSAQREFGGVNGLTQQSFEGGAGGMLVLSGPTRSRKPTENRVLNCVIDEAVDTPRAI